MILTNNFSLLPFQDKARDRMEREKAHFLFFRMGLGKTPTTTTALYNIAPSCEMVLILCPKNAIRVWEDHIKDWFAGLDAAKGEKTPYVIHRWRKRQNSPNERKALWSTRVADHINIYIMTHQGFLFDVGDISHIFNVIIVDEAKRIRGRKSKVFEALKTKTKYANFFWPMTGTPGKVPLDLWTLFHLADPKYYRSYWKFVNAFHYTQKNEWNAFEALGIRNEEQWFKTLNSKASIATKEMVKDQIGEYNKTLRQILHVDMDDEQVKYYKQLADEMYAETPDGIILTSSKMERTLRFRQLLVCPKILVPSSPSYGAAIEDLIETLTDTDPHVVIFTPFTAAFPHFRQRLNQAGYSNVFTLSGNTSADELVETIASYRKSRGIILCSIKYATAFSLEPATEAFFIGYEFDPEDNEQAEERLNRLTTRSLINAYYYCHNQTYEEDQVSIICIKKLKYQQTFDPRRIQI